MKRFIVLDMLRRIWLGMSMDECNLVTKLNVAYTILLLFRSWRKTRNG